MNADAQFHTLIEHRFDRLLHREILRLRTRYQLSLDEFRGLYVSDEQVDALLNQSREQAIKQTREQTREQTINQDIELPDIAVLTNQAHELAEQSRSQMPTHWLRLQQRFQLSDLEMEMFEEYGTYNQMLNNWRCWSYNAYYPELEKKFSQRFDSIYTGVHEISDLQRIMKAGFKS